jgi:hypothetical protein
MRPQSCKFWNCVSENVLITWSIRSLSHSGITSRERPQVPYTFLGCNDSDQQTSAELVQLSHWS